MQALFFSFLLRAVAHTRLSSSKNPHMRSKLVEVLYEFSPDADRDQMRSFRGYARAVCPCAPCVVRRVRAVAKGAALMRRQCRVRLPFVFQQIESNPTAIKYLTPALIKLYIDIETTGRTRLPHARARTHTPSAPAHALAHFWLTVWEGKGHAQFYDKFFVRRHIALLLKYLRGLPQYEGAMNAASQYAPCFLVGRVVGRVVSLVVKCACCTVGNWSGAGIRSYSCSS
jgi:hypothetical protein